MKIAIVGDTHWGARTGSKLFNDFFIKCWDDYYIPLMKEHGVTEILQLGDLFDVRKHTANYILKEIKSRHFNKLRDEGFTFHTLAGNHDLYWKESLEVVTQELVLSEYDNIKIYTKPTKIKLDNTTIDIIPWICAENEKEVFEFIKKSKSDICIGHFEFAGFAMYKGHDAADGLSYKDFEKYERVLSGHYHTRSTKDNITYTGTPYEMTWQDFNDPKGIHIFDTETREFIFYENPFTMFKRIEYNDESPKQISDFYADINQKYVRLVVNKKSNLYDFDLFIQMLNSHNPYELKIIEDLSDFSGGIIDDDINLEDTRTILANYIDNLTDVEVDKEKLKNYMTMLYNEAINIQV